MIENVLSVASDGYLCPAADATLSIATRGYLCGSEQAAWRGWPDGRRERSTGGLLSFQPFTDEALERARKIAARSRRLSDDLLERKVPKVPRARAKEARAIVDAIPAIAEPLERLPAFADTARILREVRSELLNIKAERAKDDARLHEILAASLEIEAQLQDDEDAILALLLA